MKKRLETRIELINKIISLNLKIVSTIGWGKHNTHIIERAKDDLPPKGISELDSIIVEDNFGSNVIISLKSSIRYQDLRDIDNSDVDGYKIQQDKLLTKVKLESFKKQIYRRIDDLQVVEQSENKYDRSGWGCVHLEEEIIETTSHGTVTASFLRGTQGFDPKRMMLPENKEQEEVEMVEEDLRSPRQVDFEVSTLPTGLGGYQELLFPAPTARDCDSYRFTMEGVIQSPISSHISKEEDIELKQALEFLNFYP